MLVAVLAGVAGATHRLLAVATLAERHSRAAHQSTVWSHSRFCEWHDSGRDSLRTCSSQFRWSEGLSQRTRDSVLVNRLSVYAERLEGQLRPVFGEAIARSLNLLTIRPDSDERVSLPFKVENTRPRPDLEKQMLDLVNKERQAAGLSLLQPDPELTEVARKHSADMFARGYFAHDTPEGRSPFDRMHDANVRFLTAGENLALAPTIPIAHTGLMNSPGHRANILRREFGRVGIGVMDGGMRGLMVSQEFRN